MSSLFEDLPTEFGVEIKVAPSSIILLSGASLFTIALVKKFF